jgi:Leucine-rich repeat (LRR) protein
LDGTAITPKELSLARETYMGKLTMELLGEKIGHFAFKNIAELDLRNCKIKEVDCLTKGEFRNLKRLNFDNNLLTHIDCFTGLSGLRYLSVNNNRIERLLSTDPVINPTSESFIYGNTAKSEPGPVKNLTHMLPLLEELYLGNNNISRISDLAVYRIKQLKVLYLHGNKISKVQSNKSLLITKEHYILISLIYRSKDLT